MISTIVALNDQEKAEEKPAEDRQPIKIYIISYGGDLDYMWAMVDIINASQTPVYTINIGVAASAASLIFISGHKRIMLPNSKVIIHEGSAAMSGDAVKVMPCSERYSNASANCFALPTFAFLLQAPVLRS